MWRSILLVVVIAVVWSAKARAATDTLTVGLNAEPPFIIEQGEGQRQGVSVYLWEEVAEQLDQPYQYKAYDLQGLLKAIKAGEVDLAITPMTVTSQRLQDFNLTQPFYISELTVATQQQDQSRILQFLANFFSVQFLQAISLLFLVILVFGGLLWIAERRANPEMFKNSPGGVWDGIWWAAVTMTTVGYGDKVPISNQGKVISLIWMFTAVIITSTFTASIASSLTVNTLDAEIQEIDDLSSAKLGTVTGSTGEAYIEKQGWEFRAFEEPSKALQALKAGKIEAFVYDAPILKYLLQQEQLTDELTVLPFRLNRQYYGFSTPPNTQLANKLNPLLLEELQQPGWQAVLEQYNLK
jgi:ABC-type amino acid transport/signal transduction systems, periplasmic component/domain